MLVLIKKIKDISKGKSFPVFSAQKKEKIKTKIYLKLKKKLILKIAFVVHQ